MILASRMFCREEVVGCSWICELSAVLEQVDIMCDLKRF